MNDQPTSRKPVFIEKIFPVKLLNQQVYYEHGGNPFKGLHRWYSRKPLSFSRASVLGSILPEGVTSEEFEYLLGLNRRVGGMQDTTTKLYKTPPSADRIAKVHDLCEAMWGTRTPTVLDAFAGGGSIPFEAARYGLNVLASDLNPVAVVTMKAAIEYPLKFGPDLQVDIDKWVKWVGDEAKVRLAEFFPSQAGETVVNYLWAHTVVCPSCKSVVPLSPNWWLSRATSYGGKGQERKASSNWYAVRPIPNPKEKRIDFELIKGKKGKSVTILTDNEEYDPDILTTISRGVGKCLNCGTIIENEYISSPSKESKLSHQVYAVAYKKGTDGIEFRLPTEVDLKGIELAREKVLENTSLWESNSLISHDATPTNAQYSMIRNYGILEWHQCFNTRQLLTIVTYVEIIHDAIEQLRGRYDEDRLTAIATYLSMVMSRCVDVNCKLAHVNAMGPKIEGASGQHALNLIWNYPEVNGSQRLWQWCAEKVTANYSKLCDLMDISSHTSGIFEVNQYRSNLIKLVSASADSLDYIPDKTINAIVTDPPYYGTIPYADISDFFYICRTYALT